MNRCRHWGVSLMELLVVLSLLGIASMLAFPSFQHLLERQRFDRDVEAIVTMMQYARSEAGRRQRFVYITRTTNNRGDVYTVADSDSVGGTISTLKIIETGVSNIGTADDQFYYRPNGLINETSSRELRFCLASADRSYRIETLVSGRSRVVQSNSVCL